MKYLNVKKALAAWQELQPLSEKDRERLSRRFTEGLAVVELNGKRKVIASKDIPSRRK